MSKLKGNYFEECTSGGHSLRSDSAMHILTPPPYQALV